jgi:hypothetical protein
VKTPIYHLPTKKKNQKDAIYSARAHVAIVVRSTPRRVKGRRVVVVTSAVVCAEKKGEEERRRDGREGVKSTLAKCQKQKKTNMERGCEVGGGARLADEVCSVETSSSLAARAAPPAPVFLGRAGEGEVDGTWWWRGSLAVDMRALLRRRSFECSADVVAERRVGQDGEALAGVECGGRHCGGIVCFWCW